MTVAGFAPDTAALTGILLVEHHAQRHVKGATAEARPVVGELLDPWLVAHRRMGIGRARRRIGGVDAALAMHVIQPLGPRVVRLEILVGDRPRRRDPVVVLELTEVLAAQPE